MSDIVKVRAHDLHRLLLEFRAQLERHERPVTYRGGWIHGRDYDRSFERLADIVDTWLKAGGEGPDSRTRCQPGHPVYEWPVDPGPMAWVVVTAGAAFGDIGPRLRHLAAGPTGPQAEYQSLCGFKFVDEDIASSGTTYKRCTVCAREQRVRDLSQP